jgi:putative transcriptional regulator
MKNHTISAGGILLAEPYMLDPNFKRTAVLLCEHGKGGSVGFVMNRPLAVQIDELVEDFPEFSAGVMWGGPVQTDTLHYLHTIRDLLDESVKVAEGVYWGGDFQQLKFLVSQQLVHPGSIRFFLGYSGWGEGQLEEECAQGSWIHAEMDSNYLFKTAPERLWQQAMSNKGNAYEVIAHISEEISWN